MRGNTMMVLVSWRDCQCEWQTKFCEEYHTHHTLMPRELVEEWESREAYKDGKKDAGRTGG